MPKYTSCELITILYMSEIFILDLCPIFNEMHNSGSRVALDVFFAFQALI
jgi:hypothetical protein